METQDIVASPEVQAALAWMRQRVGDAVGRTGEPIVDHARGTAAILAAIGADEVTRLAAASAAFADVATIPAADVEAGFGPEVRAVVDGMRELLRLRQFSRDVVARDPGQMETLRRMLLAMGADLRVVLLRLSSRLQTLRWHAASKREPPREMADETLQLLAPLANRLGVWQLKWELEDLSFRFLEPALYKSIARQLEERRTERERFVEDAIRQLKDCLARERIEAEVSGRPKHLYSIWSKMRAKNLAFEQVQDLRAFRVIVGEVRDCYAVLSIVHENWAPVPEEFDDYIARPKPNGYQSLHTVVLAEDGRPFEVQIRTRAMHEHAEYGVAAHWRYKERPGASAAVRAAGAASANDGDDSARRIAFARQLLAWQREVGADIGGDAPVPGEARIYVLSPQGRIVDLPAGSTPVDFAYHVHTTLGHRCRGARVDGQLVPLGTPLRNGQTVEIITAKAGSGQEGPSRDWLNAELGFVRSPRARAKVRQWFNALDLERDVAAGRAVVERTLQREGRTALSFEELVQRLGMASVQEMFVSIAKEEVGSRQLEEAIRGRVGHGETAEPLLHRPRAPAEGGRSGVLVVGVDFMLTQLARCCRPVPPDPIRGFVTRGRGISVHRADCRNLAELVRRNPERAIETAWDASTGDGSTKGHAFPVEVLVRAQDRQALLRDISDVFARDRLNVTAVNTQTKDRVATMCFTVEVPDATRLQRAITAIREVRGVEEARRR